MQLCSLELLILCFSTAKECENRWVHLNLACICLGPAFSGLWWRILWILNFTCLDAILFIKVAHTLLQHISEKRKPLSLLQQAWLVLASDQYFLDLVKDFIDTWFYLSWCNYVCKSSSDFVSALLREAKTVWFVEIWEVFKLPRISE